MCIILFSQYDLMLSDLNAVYYTRIKRIYSETFAKVFN